MALKDITRDAVLAAISEYDRVGQDEFLKTYGFKEARSYRLIYNGKAYDSKAIVGAAHGHLPGEQALASNEFSGGEATVGRLLRRLDFAMAVQAAPWGAGTLARLGALRQNGSTGSPAPHKPLLVLLALGRLQKNGSSELPWSEASEELADLITRFTPPASTSPTQRAAYPFTRLRADGIWFLDRDVAMDSVGDLNAGPVTGRLEPSMEAALGEDPALAREVARRLATENFSKKDAHAVLRAVGLNADAVLGTKPKRPRSWYERADYLDLTESSARQQCQELLQRKPVPDGERQATFLPAETLLCLAATSLVNHRKFGGSTAHLAPEPVPSLARLFNRRPSSILAKMANLDGSRSNGGKWDMEVGASLREQPKRLEYLYRVLLQAARAEGIGPDRLRDFLELLDDDQNLPGIRIGPVDAQRDAYVAGNDININGVHIHAGSDEIAQKWARLVASARSVPIGAGDPQVVDGYVTLGTLGRGAMGAVYLAQAPNEEPVAVKVVRPEFAHDEYFLQRFGEEARLASQVDGAHTAKVLRVGTHASPPYLVTEFIDGPTLDEAVTARQGPLAPEDVKSVAIGTSIALIAIHNAGIVHRDLKPSNVMLSRFGPRVIDFGIAKSLNEAKRITRTGVGAPVGSPAYMAPEQIKGETVTSATDIFAWAGLMVYIATGHHPFDKPDENVHALYYRVLEKDPDLSGVPEDLRDLIAGALKKDREARPTARQILNTLTGA